MDFSEKYIKMCQKAEEIQKEWKPKVGDWVIDVWNEKRPLVICVVRDNPDYFYLSDQFASDKVNIYQNHISKLYWLPRQDQLQEMLKSYFADIFSIIVNFGLWCDGTYSLNISKNYIKQFTTMEELWLTFLMYEKYRKIWNGKKEKWIKKEER